MLKENIIRVCAYFRAINLPLSTSFFIFMQILLEGDLDFSSSVEICGITVSNAEKAIKQLEDTKLIGIQPSSGTRSRILSLTPKGRRIVQFLFEEN